MESLGNVNNAISIVGHCIFDYNYKKALFLTQELLDIICSTSIGKELVATFISVFYAVRYSWAPGNLKKDKHDTVKKETKFRKKYEDSYYIYILIFDHYIMKIYIKYCIMIIIINVIPHHY